MDVPTEGIVTKVGTKVPMMLPMVLNAPSRPTVLPLSSRLSIVYLASDGVTVPSRNSGNTKTAMHETNAAQIRKLLLTEKMSSAEMPRMIYLPTTGIRPIHTAANKMRPYSLSGLGSLSAERPPKILPSAIAIIIVPMIIVHTICDELKYGASSRLAPSSTAITDMPAKNSVRYRYVLLFRIPFPCIYLPPACAAADCVLFPTITAYHNPGRAAIYSLCRSKKPPRAGKPVCAAAVCLRVVRERLRSEVREMHVVL